MGGRRPQHAAEGAVNHARSKSETRERRGRHRVAGWPRTAVRHARADNQTGEKVKRLLRFRSTRAVLYDVAVVVCYALYLLWKANQADVEQGQVTSEL